MLRCDRGVIPLLDQAPADPIDAVLVRRGAIALQPVRGKEAAEHGALLIAAGIAVNEEGLCGAGQRQQWCGRSETRRIYWSIPSEASALPRRPADRPQPTHTCFRRARFPQESRDPRARRHQRAPPSGDALGNAVFAGM